MRASTGLRPSKLGVAFLFLIAASLSVGKIRGEMVLTLTGALLSVAAAYCLLGVLLLALINRKKARSLSPRIPGKTLKPGGMGEVLLAGQAAARGRFFRLPALLVRCEIHLATRDGRIIRHSFDPDHLDGGSSPFPVEERGAYYGTGDRLVISDALGIFRFAFPLEAGEGSGETPRLLVSPLLPEEAAPLRIRSGGTERWHEAGFQRTDDLTDHRPYIPGDDPRRINWKLYGHAGDLFVREGEPEPPPHSRLLILIDTQVDPALFNGEAGRRGVDLLCESALAAAREYGDRGMEVITAYTGGALREGGSAELAAALAWPAALPLQTEASFPLVPENRGVLILALPRSSGEPSALDRFLKNRGNGRETDLVFLYQGAAPDGPAKTCAALYGQKPGVHARYLQIPGGLR